jgi:hypothetical protein
VKQIIFTLVFFIAGALGAAGKNKLSAESQAAVQEAQAILLKTKDRKAAMAILADRIRVGAETQELQKELLNIANVFLTEEGQKTFELAESMLYSANAGALAKYEEALVKEPSNVQIMLGIVRTRIFRNECAAGEEIMRQVSEFLPAGNHEARVIKERLFYCTNKKVMSKGGEGLVAGELKKHHTLLLAQSLVGERKLVEAKKLLHHKDFDGWEMPEVNYWRYKAVGNDSPEAIEFAQQYVAQCSEINSATRRKFRYEPALCANLVEADEFVKKHEAVK